MEVVVQVVRRLVVTDAAGNRRAQVVKPDGLGFVLRIPDPAAGYLVLTEWDTGVNTHLIDDYGVVTISIESFEVDAPPPAEG
jgi:hypothetical protein